VTPAARLSAAIELLSAIDAAPRKPADAIANDFFRQRRFIGSGDRRAVSDRVWRIMRTHRRLAWWLDRVGARVNPRQMLAASLLTEGWTLAGVAQSFSGGAYGATPLVPAEAATLTGIEGHTLDHPHMPAAVRLELSEWVLPQFQARFGADLAPEVAAMEASAPLDLRVNLLKGDRETGSRPSRRRCRPGACASRAAARSPPARRSRAAWWKSRTRAANWSPRWSAPNPRCGWWIFALAPAARRWRWRWRCRTAATSPPAT